MHIQAWASALPSDIGKAMREASERRTVTDTDSYAFLRTTTNANERMTAALLYMNIQTIAGYIEWIEKSYVEFGDSDRVLFLEVKLIKAGYCSRLY